MSAGRIGEWIARLLLRAIGRGGALDVIDEYEKYVREVKAGGLLDGAILKFRLNEASARLEKAERTARLLRGCGIDELCTLRHWVERFIVVGELYGNDGFILQPPCPIRPNDPRWILEELDRIIALQRERALNG